LIAWRTLLPILELLVPNLNVATLLDAMIPLDASDLHIKVGKPPTYRIHGHLTPAEGYPALTAEDTRTFALSMIDQDQRDIFNKERELDCSYHTDNARFRVNVMLQRGHVGVVIRIIPIKIKSLEDLGLPPVVRELACKPRGLVLVTGPTGSGKSTTLAAMVDYINTNEGCHIVTIEDPIEFVHEDKQSLVNQREVGSDTLSFGAALKRVLRQDPDVILIGELRDIETVSAAITAAETGHLVFATLHTTSAAQTIDRVIDVFPAHQQNQVRSQLSTVLEGVLSQTLVTKASGGRQLVIEVMTASSAIRNLIREGKIYQIPSAIQSGSNQGMQTLEMHLRDLVRASVISRDIAMATAGDPTALLQLMQSR
jgi:twitching motility protein PilT